MFGSVLGLIVGLIVTVVVWTTLDLVFSEERQVARRLRTLSDGERQQASEVEPLSVPFRQRILAPTGESVGKIARGFLPAKYREGFERRTRMAGHPRGVDGDGMIALKVLLGVLFFVLGVVYSLAAWESVWPAALFGLFGWYVPNVWLRGRIQERKDNIRRELPDMLDMLMISVEAGLGFDASVTKYIRNRTGALSEEFGVELNEVQAGLSRREALRNLAQRCDVFELNTFCMAMVQADVFGVSVGSVLRTQSKEIRLKRRQHAEEMAQKVPVKMVFPLILCIFPATLIAIMAPAVVRIMEAFGSMG